jgi:23S rRNA (cytosine1962-C5)-methyltransferase
MAQLPVVRLKVPAARRPGRGHPWIYGNEVGKVEGLPGAGALVRVADREGRRVGEGWFSPASRIRVRLVSAGPEPEVEGPEGVLVLLRERLAAAGRLREALGRPKASRLVFGESDGIPGLVVDRYGDAAVFQLLCAGTEALREPLTAMLGEVFGTPVAVERSDTGNREREGLAPVRGVRAGGLPEGGLVPFSTGGLELVADVLEGQKTGFYLDQVDNWLALRSLAGGRRVLDLCCYTGAFGLSMLAGGAASLTGMDSSRRAVETATESARRNGFSAAEFRCADALEAVPKMGAAGERFDLVLVDPPAMARTRAHRDLAIKAYRAYAACALAVTAPGGLVFSCSCTPWVGVPELADLVSGEATRAGREAVLLEVRGQSRDHPIHPLMPETAYLTGTLWHVP